MIFDFILSEHELGKVGYRSRLLCPDNLCDDPRGLSGTEVNAIGLAHAIRQKRHVVRLYSLLTHEIWHDGLEWYDLRKTAPDGTADVAVAFHDGRPLWHWPAQKRVAWHQTFAPPFYQDMAQEPVDLYISATAHNAEHLEQYTAGKPWKVIPNGWDFGKYPEPKPFPGRLFYHTSPERGLHILLKALPQIKAQVPATHLDIWCRMNTSLDVQHPALWKDICDGLEQCKDYVTLHAEGGSRNTVLAALAQAQVLAYPSEPPVPCEVMPVSLMEACALGIPVFVSPSDNFHAAFPGAIGYCNSPPSAHLDDFVCGTVQILTEPILRLRASMTEREWASEYTFARTSDRFLAIMEELLS